MNIPAIINEKISRRINSDKSDTNPHIINRKANAKMNYVVNVFQKALPEKIEAVENGFLDNTILFKNTHYLKKLRMFYFVQNRFWARIYDLKLFASISDNYKEKARFELVYNGITQIKGARFVYKENGNAEAAAEAEKVAQLLNNDMIIKRIKELQFINMIIEYNLDTKAWEVKATSIVGSAVWNLIPPILQVIKPTAQECVWILELFELIAYSLLNRNERIGERNDEGSKDPLCQSK